MIILVGTMGQGNSSSVAQLVSFRARKSPTWFVLEEEGQASLMEGVEGPKYIHELVESVDVATQASTISAHEILASTEGGGIIVSI